MERYNIRISFKGDSSLKFNLGVIGEVIIYAGRDIYVQNISANLIESLRSLKQLGLDITIGGKSDGCYKTYDILKYVPRTLRPELPRTNKVSRADVRAILENTQEPDTVESIENLEEQVQEIESNSKKLEDYIITTETSSAVGKQLKELSVRQLKGLLRYLNDKDKEMVQLYLAEE